MSVQDRKTTAIPPLQPTHRVDPRRPRRSHWRPPSLPRQATAAGAPYTARQGQLPSPLRGRPRHDSSEQGLPTRQGPPRRLRGSARAPRGPELAALQL